MNNIIDWDALDSAQLRDIRDEAQKRYENSIYKNKIDKILSHRNMIGRCFVDRKDCYYYILSAKSENIYWLEALTFSPYFPDSVSAIERSRTYKYTESLIEYDPIRIESIPYYISSSIGYYEEIKTSVFWEKYDKYLKEFKEKIIDGFFDTSAELEEDNDAE